MEHVAYWFVDAPCHHVAELSMYIFSTKQSAVTSQWHLSLSASSSRPPDFSSLLCSHMWKCSECSIHQAVCYIMCVLHLCTLWNVSSYSPALKTTVQGFLTGGTSPVGPHIQIVGPGLENSVSIPPQFFETVTVPQNHGLHCEHFTVAFSI